MGIPLDYDGHVRDQDEPVTAMGYLTDEPTTKSLEFIDTQAAAGRSSSTPLPFILRWPGKLPAGNVYRQPVSPFDAFPTVAAACGTAAGKPLDGVDLLPFLAGTDTASPHDVLYWGYQRQTGRWAIRKGRWKMARDIVDYKAVQPGRVDMETALHDLEEDPGESKNLFAERPEVAAELTALEDAWYAMLPESIATPEVRRAWQEELAQRKEKLPDANRLRRDGAPGHWLGQ